MFEFIILILIELAGKSNRDILHFSGHGGRQEGDGDGEYFFVMCVCAHKKFDLFTRGGRKSRSRKEGKRRASLSGLGGTFLLSRWRIEIHGLSFRQDEGEVIGGNKCSLSF